MDFWANVSKRFLTFFCSSFDISSDIINSVDFLGYNLSSPIPREENVILDVNYETHKIWGTVSFFIIFLPGFVMAIPHMLIYFWESRKNKENFAIGCVATLFSVTYPINPEDSFASHTHSLNDSLFGSFTYP